MEPKREDIDSSISKDNLLYGKYVGQGVDLSEGNVTQKVFNKKGQVTIFIIVGIIILVAAAAVFFVTRSTVTERLTAEGEPVIEVPTEFIAIKQFTENCLIDVGKQGLLLLGEQGGYIYPDLVGEYSVVNPTDSDGLNLEPLKIPYWHYNKEPNAGNKIVFSSLQPKLYSSQDKEMSVEAQLGRFVNEKLEGCLQGYQAIEKQGYDVEVLSLPDAEVHVTDDYVQFWLKFDVEARRGESKHSFDTFFMKVPLSFKQYYDAASQILDAEKKQAFLERQGMELLSVYAGIDPLHFPPISEVTYDFVSTVSWNEGMLKQRFKEVLTSNVPFLRFLGSSNFYYSLYPEGNLLAQKIVDNMVLPLAGAESTEVRFDYFDWEPYFKTNSEEGTIKPEHIFVKYGVLSFGQQRYETHYDASYPVLITVHDDTAFDGKGYTFTIALESNIRNNAPAKPDEIRETYPRRISPLACREEQKSTELIKTVVVDSFTKEPVDLVKVGFTIPNQAECEVGLTDKQGALEENYPAVYGGVVNFIKEGYLTNFYPLDTYKYKDKPLLLGYAVAGVEPENVMELDKIVKRTVKVEKKVLPKCLTPLEPEYTVAAVPVVGSLGVIPYKDISSQKGTRQCFFNSGNTLLTAGEPLLEFTANNSVSQFHEYYFLNHGRALEEDERALVTLERVAGFHEQVRGDEFVATFSVKGDTRAEIDLVPGVYKVSGTITRDKPLKIPAEQRCFAYTLLTWDKEECFTLEGATVDTYIEGSVQWETPESYLLVTPEQLYTAQEIVFSIPVQDLWSIPEQTTTKARKCAGWACVPYVGCAGESCDTDTIAIAARVVEDLQVPGKITELSSQPEMRRLLEPTFR